DVEFLQDTAVSVEGIKSRIRQSKAEQVLLLIDACRNQPGGRTTGANLMTTAFANAFELGAQNRGIKAFAALYGISVGERVYECVEKKMGYFTWAVVNALEGSAANQNGEVTLQRLIRYVQETVPKRVHTDLGQVSQIPFAVVEGYRAEDLILSSVRPRLKPQISPEEASGKVLAIEELYSET